MINRVLFVSDLDELLNFKAFAGLLSFLLLSGNIGGFLYHLLQLN